MRKIVKNFFRCMVPSKKDTPPGKTRKKLPPSGPPGKSTFLFHGKNASTPDPWEILFPVPGVTF